LIEERQRREPSRLERCLTPMGTVPISSIYGFNYTAQLDEENLNSQNSYQAPKRGAVVKESEVKVETSPCWPSSLPTSSWPSSLPARRAAAATKPAPQTARPPLPPPRSAPQPPPRARPPPPSPPTRRVVAPPASLQPGLNNTKELHPTSGAGAGGLSGGSKTPARQFSYSFTARMSRPPPPQRAFSPVVSTPSLSRANCWRQAANTSSCGRVFSPGSWAKYSTASNLVANIRRI